jgi:predicted nuclease of predicted toxin-antitoxin system
VPVKLLLGENLSPAAAVALAAHGIDACHVRDRGLLSATDREILERAYQDDRVLVTSNVADFVKLARARELHAGIVLIERGDLLRDEQIALLRNVVLALAKHGAMINELLRIEPTGTMTFEICPEP